MHNKEKEIENAVCYGSFTIFSERDIVVIKTNDRSYHLLKLLANPYETEEMAPVDYHHQFPPVNQVVAGQLPQIELMNNKGDVYYLNNNSKKNIVSAFCVVIIAHYLKIVIKKRWDKDPNNLILK